MHKALEVMNLKLPEVVSDITGMTGLAFIKDILAGIRDPLQLAKHRDRRCKNTESAIAQALNGSYRDEHVFALEQALAGWEFYQQQLRAVDTQIEAQLRAMKKRQELPPLPPKPRLCKRKANEPRFDVRTALYYVTGVDLTALEGIDGVTALVVVSEIGTDMTRWPTVRHFCSWLGLCPHLKKTGGRVKSSRTRPGSNRAANALRLGASTLHRNKARLGAYFRRMKSRLVLGPRERVGGHRPVLPSTGQPAGAGSPRAWRHRRVALRGPRWQAPRRLRKQILLPAGPR
jgi:transposase